MAIQPQHPLYPGDLVASISQFLEPELAAVQRVLHDVLDSESALIREVGDYISLASGKKLRPMISLLFARAYGPAGLPPPIHVAAAMEAVHVATLLHDDVIDKAPLRRGQPSVNAKWGDDVAILMADYLYSSAFELALQHLEPEALRLITQVTRRMCEGEMFQIERRGKLLAPEDYLQIISAKTAYLFSGCAAMGCIAAGLTNGTVAAASAYGLNFGLAFQITDDTLDLTGDDAELGKHAGVDLIGGKQTLPLILAVQSAAPEDRSRLQAALGEGRDYAFIREMIVQYNTVPKALEMARNYAAQAAAELATLSATEEAAVDYLRALPAYLVGRRQ